MKLNFFTLKAVLFCISWLLLFSASGQDVLLDIKGEEHRGRVTEIGLDSVKFRAESDTLKRRSLARKDVFMIRYANGLKEVFPENLAQPPVVLQQAPTLSDKELYQLGRADGKRLFKVPSGVFIGGLLCGASLFIYGVIPAGIISGVAPNQRKLIPLYDARYAHLESYQKGFANGAKSKKAGPALGGWLGGTIAVLLLILASVGYPF